MKAFSASSGSGSGSDSGRNGIGRNGSSTLMLGVLVWNRTVTLLLQLLQH